MWFDIGGVTESHYLTKHKSCASINNTNLYMVLPICEKDTFFSGTDPEKSEGGGKWECCISAFYAKCNDIHVCLAWE